MRVFSGTKSHFFSGPSVGSLPSEEVVAFNFTWLNSQYFFQTKT